MSQKKHKGNHATRAERRAAEKRQKQNTLTTIDKPRRIYLRNGLHIFLTILVVIASVGGLILLGFTGWWDSFIGSVLAIAVGAFGVMCLVDLGLLFSTCVAFGEGMVSAGKNAEGTRMVFHASAVTHLEVRDTNGNVLPKGQAVYKNVDLTFVMSSGRVNLKRLSRLTDQQLRMLEEALEAERRVDCAY